MQHILPLYLHGLKKQAAYTGIFQMEQSHVGTDLY